ncbi:MAG: hypothetical protein R3B48_11180 [Kofleriaceae bacterium]
MRSLRRHCLILSVAAIAALSACKKEGDSGGAGGGGGGGAAADDLNVIPKDSDFVLEIDLGKLRGSALFKEHGQQLVEKAASELTKFKDTCGFDPVESAKRVVVGVKMNGDKASGSIIFHSTVSKVQIKACLEKSKAEIEKDGTKLEMDGDIAFLTPSKEEAFGAVTFLGSDGVVVLFKDSAWTKDQVQAALTGGGSIKGSKDFGDLHSARKKNQTLWMYMNGASPMLAKAAPMKLDAVGFFGTVDLTDGLSSQFRARMKTAADAQQIEAAMKGQLASAQMFFSKIEAKVDGSDLIIDADMSAKQLQGMMSMALGGMMGRQ